MRCRRSGAGLERCYCQSAGCTCCEDDRWILQQQQQDRPQRSREMGQPRTQQRRRRAACQDECRRNMHCRQGMRRVPIRTGQDLRDQGACTEGLAAVVAVDDELANRSKGHLRCVCLPSSASVSAWRCGQPGPAALQAHVQQRPEARGSPQAFAPRSAGHCLAPAQARGLHNPKPTLAAQPALLRCCIRQHCAGWKARARWRNGVGHLAEAFSQGLRCWLAMHGLCRFVVLAQAELQEAEAQADARCQPAGRTTLPSEALCAPLSPWDRLCVGCWQPCWTWQAAGSTQGHHHERLMVALPGSVARQPAKVRQPGRPRSRAPGAAGLGSDTKPSNRHAWTPWGRYGTRPAPCSLSTCSPLQLTHWPKHAAGQQGLGLPGGKGPWLCSSLRTDRLPLCGTALHG